MSLCCVSVNVCVCVVVFSLWDYARYDIRLFQLVFFGGGWVVVFGLAWLGFWGSWEFLLVLGSFLFLLWECLSCVLWLALFF